MRTTCESTTDTLTLILIILASKFIAVADEINPGVIFDSDKKGNSVSPEILDASQRVSVLFCSQEPDFFSFTTFTTNPASTTATRA